MGKCVSNKMDTHFHLVILEFNWNLTEFRRKLVFLTKFSSVIEKIN